MSLHGRLRRLERGATEAVGTDAWAELRRWAGLFLMSKYGLSEYRQKPTDEEIDAAAMALTPADMSWTWIHAEMAATGCGPLDAIRVRAHERGLLTWPWWRAYRAKLARLEAEAESTREQDYDCGCMACRARRRER